MTSPPWRSALVLAIPVLASVAALFVHHVMHVPRGEMELRAKKKKEVERVTRAEYEFSPRDDREIAHELERWSDEPFEKETEIDEFADGQREFLDAAIVKARNRALHGMPDPVDFEHAVECRTIRCRIWMCGWPHEVVLVEEAFAGARIADEPAFLAYEAAVGLPPTIVDGDLGERAGSGERIEEGPDSCFVITLALRRDTPSVRALSF